MSSINKAILIGHLGKDPEVRAAQNGKSVANFSIATSESWNDAQGNRQERTEWHNIVVWGKLADICGQYLAKGRQVYVEGRIQTRKWQDKDGADRYTTEIVADNVTFLGGGEKGERQGGGHGNASGHGNAGGGGGWGGQSGGTGSASGGWGGR